MPGVENDDFNSCSQFFVDLHYLRRLLLLRFHKREWSCRAFTASCVHANEIHKCRSALPPIHCVKVYVNTIEFISNTMTAVQKQQNQVLCRRQKSGCQSCTEEHLLHLL